MDYWTFWTRLESENEYTKEKQVKDNSILTSLYCGIYCIYTKTRCKGFTFHHIQLSNDVETTTKPTETPDEPDKPDVPEDRFCLIIGRSQGYIIIQRNHV